MSRLIRKEKREGKDKQEASSVTPKELRTEMDKILEQYGASRSQADLDKTKKILERAGSLSDELASMRDEDR